MRSSNLARNIAPMGTKQFAPWNVFSALLLLPDQQSLSMMKRVFEGFGMNVHAATTVQEADQILHSTRLDLAVCDFDVPRADELFLLQPSSRWRGVTVGLMPIGPVESIKPQAYPVPFAQAGQHRYAGAEPEGVLYQHGAGRESLRTGIRFP